MAELQDIGRALPQTAVQFWLDRQSSYQRLSKVALDLVSSPASQAYVERLFSLCGELTARKRNRARVSIYRRVFLKLNRHVLWTATVQYCVFGRSVCELWSAKYKLKTDSWVLALQKEASRRHFWEPVFLSFDLIDYLLPCSSVIHRLKHCLSQLTKTKTKTNNYNEIADKTITKTKTKINLKLKKTLQSIHKYTEKLEYVNK